MDLHPRAGTVLLWYFSLETSGEFDFHSAVLQRLKGWGKDPVAATLGAGHLFGPTLFDRWEGDRPIGRDNPNAWVQMVAVSLQQTQNTMKLFPALFSPEARRRYGVQVGRQNVWGMGDTRQIEAVTSSVMAIEGGRPSLIVRNETQNWNSSNGGHAMAGAIEGNAAKSEVGSPARMLDICNAYRPGEDSVGQRAREAYEQTVGENAQFIDFGVLYDSLEAPPEAPLTMDAAPSVVKAVRGDAVWLDARAASRSRSRTRRTAPVSPDGSGTTRSSRPRTRGRSRRSSIRSATRTPCSSAATKSCCSSTARSPTTRPPSSAAACRTGTSSPWGCGSGRPASAATAGSRPARTSTRPSSTPSTCTGHRLLRRPLACPRRRDDGPLLGSAVRQVAPGAPARPPRLGVRIEGRRGHSVMFDMSARDNARDFASAVAFTLEEIRSGSFTTTPTRASDGTSSTPAATPSRATSPSRRTAVSRRTRSTSPSAWSVPAWCAG